MKRVRLMAGAAGIAPLALALAPAAPHAATAPASHTKSVRSAGPAAKTPKIFNPLCAIIDNSAHKGIFYAGAEWSLSGGCMANQRAVLLAEQTGLADRIRDYAGTVRTRQVYIAGVIGSGKTAWSYQDSAPGSETCQALVANSNHNVVRYGPVCVRP
jgi:hypothetical protein